jgi:hypothetical protein
MVELFHDDVKADTPCEKWYNDKVFLRWRERISRENRSGMISWFRLPFEN